MKSSTWSLWNRNVTSVSAAALVAALAGCAENSNPAASLDSAVKRLFEPKRTPQQHMIIAVSDADADVRRESVTELAESDLSGQDWAIKGYVAIATLESDPQARCVAIRALAQTRDPRAVEACLKVLNYQDSDPKEVRPPDELTRWDATLALANLSDGAVPEDKKSAVRDTLLLRLAKDTNRSVRCAAARGLGFYPALDVVQALIQGLRDEHYAVAHECENALVMLTGVTNGGSVSAWETWLEDNQAQPFAKAGTVPESRRKPYDGKLGKAAHDTKQFVQWMFPAKK